jgi:hypothetical protein
MPQGFSLGRASKLQARERPASGPVVFDRVTQAFGVELTSGYHHAKHRFDGLVVVPHEVPRQRVL